MSKPASRARLQASTYSCWTSRMSCLSISLQERMNANGLPIADAPRAGTRLSSPHAFRPPCQISTAASASCSWSMSHIRPRLRTSPSSQSRALTRWMSSLSGPIEQYSVQTAPQPPSAFIARKCDWKPGRSEPAPLQCATWKKRLGSVFGPIWIGSKRMSYLGSRAIVVSYFPAAPGTGTTAPSTTSGVAGTSSRSLTGARSCTIRR